MSGITDFIGRWKVSGGSEQANSQSFLKELCDVLDLQQPDPADPVNEKNAYVFERKVYVTRGDGTKELKKLDLYYKGRFVLESKQGQDAVGAKSFSSLLSGGMTASSAVKRGTRQWEDSMQRAKRQAENYIRSLPASEGRPPFLIVTDVGYCFDLYTEFTCTGGLYLHFPDTRTYRVMLDDLARPEVRALFQAIWKDPLSLDPSRRSAKVTEEIADHLALLARLLEKDGHEPEQVSQFLMRCIFSMFAEDMSLIPAGSFTDIIQKSILQPGGYKHYLNDLWNAMNKGEFSVLLDKQLLRFNGHIFYDPEVLPLEREHLGILLEAAKADWREVEPAIFGTLLEHALNPKERHKLGAHYTPRAYVERLVIPTVMQPLRKEWDDVQTTASVLFNQGKEKEACKTVAGFHERLRGIRVLDPACGSGNFLYVTMEHMKRLEGEVLQALASYGERQASLLQIDPHQFLGLEINPRAAHIAEMVLWIGFLQWHFRTCGNVNPPEPVIRQFDNIQHKDALIAYKGWKYATDEDGKPITRWDGETYKTDPATGRQMPDEKAVVVDEVYEGVKAAEWPEADFIVGNPPFIGGWMKRSVLGHGMFDALTKTYARLPESCDFVMYWWHKAADLVRAGKVKRFGFITTNSITHVFNRRVVSLHLGDKKPLRLVFAVSDHPWVEASDSAAVRIAMTVGEKGKGEGVLATVVEERETGDKEIAVTMTEQNGVIHANLRQGTDVTKAESLAANDELCCPGVKLHGSGFIVTPMQAASLGLGHISGLERHIRLYRNGRDIANGLRGVMVIDLFGLTAKEVRHKYPEVYQWVYTRVKPERDANNRNSYRENWWVFGEPRKEFRPALAGLPRYISTIETAKHRFFLFLPAEVLPDNRLVNIASADAYHLGVLSSNIHVRWAMAAGGTLGPGRVYTKSRCFDTYPFPDANPEQQARIRDLGEQLDAHRKKRQSLHPDLTMTDMYNVLEALRQSRMLTDRERNIHEQGLVSVLRNLHDELDAAVFDAYGWSANLTDEEILSRLVALNAERAEEEKNGQIRWLRPEYQSKSRAERSKMVQDALALDSRPEPAARGKKGAKTAPKSAWPSDQLEQTQAVRDAINTLRETAIAITPETVAKRFTRPNNDRVKEILRALETLGFV
ncbi:MAG: class I SAM-dependent DNA methyltransferase [Betaproteobacteria bacterium]|nr:class I SAM-dependent DNA methyltransferase [Betaproteobacteria bacterium]